MPAAADRCRVTERDGVRAARVAARVRDADESGDDRDRSEQAEDD
jgi:hypothetical protein